MRRFMISGMHSGSGKTVLTCGLLQAFRSRGLSVAGFKCGPDYIDPMFHRQVLGIPSRNLDLYLQGEEGIRRSLEKARGDLVILEGAMGYYDGVNGTEEASAWETADTLDIPVVLAVRAKGVSLTLAAQIKGMLTFRSPCHIVGVILTDCGPMMYSHLRPILEKHAGIPAFGFLPPMKEAILESRHLGLVTAGEIADLKERFVRIGAQTERTVDLDALLSCVRDVDEGAVRREREENRCTIAVAKDEAFCFYYEDSLDALRRAGAKLRYFSPIHDRLPPEAHGLYLGGGYPELYVNQLSWNTEMRAWIRSSVREGMPTVAECGGFLYLLQSLESDQGEFRPMAGALEGKGYRTNALQRFGYLDLTADEESLLFRPGEEIPAHEFHYWEATECGSGLKAKKRNGRQWRCAVTSPSIYAGFPHLHFDGKLPLAKRFVDAAIRYRASHRQQNTGRETNE